MTPPAAKKLKIEMVGDSITCGYGNEGGVEETQHDTSKENPMGAYSLLTATHLDADVNVVAWNGKGVITAYIGEDAPKVKDADLACADALRIYGRRLREGLSSHT